MLSPTSAKNILLFYSLLSQLKNNILTVTLLLMLSGYASIAQPSRTIKGRILDSNAQPIEGALIKIFVDKDTLKTISDSEGKFSLKNIPYISFELTITTSRFKPVKKSFSFKNDETTVIIPLITLDLNPLILEEVKIGLDKQPLITFKRDTIQYNVNAFKIDSNLTVEDLLRKLPNMEVDKNGELIHEDRTVYKLRVNGKDFFTSNVKDYIRLLPANIISKIQIINDYGDQATFTGIKKFEGQKLLNLVTKDGINGGTFGYTDAKLGSNSGAGIGLNASYWHGDKQISFNSNFERVNKAEIANSSNSLNLIYNNRISEEVQLTSNYRYTSNYSNYIDSVSSETLIPNGSIFNHSESKIENNNRNHILNLALVYTPTSSTQIRVIPSISLSKTDFNSKRSSLQTGDIQQELTSKEFLTTTPSSLRTEFSIDHRFKKDKRAISFQTSMEENKNNAQKEYFNTISYTSPTTNSRKDSILNLRIHDISEERKISFSFAFNEPLTEKANLQFKAFNETTRSLINFKTDLILSSNIQNLDSLSNTSIVNNSVQVYSLNYTYGTKKIDLFMGINFQHNSIKNKQSASNFLSKNTHIFFPTSNFKYYLNQNSSIELTYSGLGTPPSKDELQQTRDESDIQNILIGNPNLKPSFEHKIDLKFQNQSKTGKYFLSSLFFTTIRDQIALKRDLVKDSTGISKQQTHYINLNGYRSFGARYTYTIPIHIAKLTPRIIFKGQFSLDHIPSIIENAINSNRVVTAIQTVSSSIDTKVLNITTSVQYSNTSSVFSIEPLQNSAVKTIQFNTTSSLYFLKKYKVEIELNKRKFIGYRGFKLANPLFVNLNFERSLFRNNIGKLSIQVTDLLDEGNTTERTFFGNTITDKKSSFTTRYFTLTFRINLSRFNKSKT